MFLSSSPLLSLLPLPLSLSEFLGLVSCRFYGQDMDAVRHIANICGERIINTFFTAFKRQPQLHLSLILSLSLTRSLSFYPCPANAKIACELYKTRRPNLQFIVVDFCIYHRVLEYKISLT